MFDLTKPEDISSRIIPEQVLQDFYRQPHLFMRLAENALTVSESLRNNYFKNTTAFVTDLRKTMVQTADGRRREALLEVCEIEDTDWTGLRGEVVTFIDGGMGSVRISSQVPILLRVGSYTVRTGERQLSEREQFRYYPVILGDLEGGSKERRDFPDIVRITAELLGGLSALERMADLRVLMFHGPLVYLMSGYAGHTPFTESDIDLFLSHYAPGSTFGDDIKEDFLSQAQLDIYPRMTDRSDEWVERRLFEPLAWISYLYGRIIKIARVRDPSPMIAGVVERSRVRDFSENVLLCRVFRGLRKKGNISYFNEMYGRTDLTSPKSLLDRLGYTDSLLLGMLLKPGQYSEPWEMQSKYEGLRRGNVSLPGESGTSVVNFEPLKPGKIGFPRVLGYYVHVADNVEPIRVEVFRDLQPSPIDAIARRTYMYARLLPGYGFPVGLDIADKYAHVPNWLTDAYSKLIRHHLGVSLQTGQISDVEMRRILIEAIYMTHRDWLFRPEA